MSSGRPSTLRRWHSRPRRGRADYPPYYFPVAGDKWAPYRDIRSAELRRMDWLTAKLRLWGSHDLTCWLALDLHRFRKDALLVLGVGRRFKPAASPSDPDRVLALLRDHLLVTDRR